MPNRAHARPRRRRVVIVSTGALLLTSAAVASAAPVALQSGPGVGSVDKYVNTAPTYTWSGGTGPFDTSLSPLGLGTTPVSPTSAKANPIGEGVYAFTVTDTFDATFDTAQFVYDVTNPTLTSTPASTPAWYNASAPASISIVWHCEAGAGVPATAAPLTAAWSGDKTDTFTNASGTSTATCTDQAGNASTGSLAVNIDRTAPVFTLVEAGGTTGKDLSGTPTGWFVGGTPTANYTCTETGSGLAAPCPADIPVTTDSVVNAAGGVISDVAGNSSGVAIPGISIKRDATAPTKPGLSTIGPVTNLLRPPFQWAGSTDVTSGVAGYELVVKSGGSTTYDSATDPAYAGTGKLIPDGSTQVTAPLPADLKDGGSYTWTVKAFDVAGNSVTSSQGAFSVDTSTPNAPGITAGPVDGGATNSTKPTWNFGGLPGAQFKWQLKTQSGTVITPFAAYSTTATFTPAAALTDGTYLFEVQQLAPNGKESAITSAIFAVDTVVPGQPVMTSSPGPNAVSQPTFSWRAAEPGGSFQWQITGIGGARVQGPLDTTATTLQVPAALANGSYVFQVRQRDRAGNLSEWSLPEPFTVTGGSSGGGNTNPIDGGGTVTKYRPGTRNASLMYPKVGAVLNSTKVTLRWKRTPGATLYNVQVFILSATGGTTVKKVHYAFPHGVSYRIPKRILKPGQRYVWRVWPYLGARKRYTKNPFGISWFDTKTG